MNCEDVEVELAGGELTDAARTHRESCASCAQTARLLDLVTLAPVSEAEKMLL